MHMTTGQFCAGDFITPGQLIHIAPEQFCDILRLIQIVLFTGPYSLDKRLTDTLNGYAVVKITSLKGRPISGINTA